MSTPARVMPLRSPLPKPAPRRTSPLRLVPPRRSSAAKTPVAAVLVVLLGGGLLGLLLLNTMVAQQSFSLHDLSAKDKALTQQEQDLNQQVQDLEAPASLAARAAALHMVPSGAPAFLRLSDGKVLGKPQPGVAPVVPKASTTWTGPKQPTKAPPTTSRTTTNTTNTTTRTSSTGAHR
jgi:hypothetical protein